MLKYVNTMKQSNTTDKPQPLNRDESDVNFTASKQIPNGGDIIKEQVGISEETEGLTAEELLFTRLVAKGLTPTTAYRQSFPKAKNQAYGTVRNKALSIMQQNAIVTEIETVRETKARLARLAEDRIEQILVEDNSSRKGSKVAEVAMFVYDHSNGKATQRIETTSKSVSVNIDLTGTVTDEQASEHRGARTPA